MTPLLLIKKAERKKVMWIRLSLSLQSQAVFRGCACSLVLAMAVCTFPPSSSSIALSPPPSLTTSCVVHQLSEELLELILAFLPVSSALVASSVCKLWSSTVSSPTFAALRARAVSKPWFFLCGVNYYLPAKDQVFAFDPHACKWSRLPCLSPPPHDQSSLAGMDGVVFALKGVEQSSLCYTAGLVKPVWKTTSCMSFARCDPLLAVVGDCHSGSHKIIVTGGVDDGDPLSVEIYDALTDSWELCPSLPDAFGKFQCPSWMSSVVYKGKFYVSKNNTGEICAFDLEQKTWSSLRMLHPQWVTYSHLLVCDGMLLLAGLLKGGQETSIRLWQVDEDAMRCGKEIGIMPSEMFSLFWSENDEKNVALKCLARVNVLYIYSDSVYKDYASCMCEISSRGCSWTRLPSLPSPVNRFDKVICLSSVVPIESCL